MELRTQLCVDFCCPPVVSLFYTTKSSRKRIPFIGFVLLRVKRDDQILVFHAQSKVRGLFLLRKEDNYEKSVWENTQQAAS